MVFAFSFAFRAMLASIFAPGGEKFDEKLKGVSVLDETRLDPIPAGKISREYLTACRAQVAKFIADGQAGQVRRAAQRLADCQSRNGVIWTVSNGHLHMRGLTVPNELTRLFMYGRAWQWTAPQGLQPGDTLFYIGYIDYPQTEVESSLKAGANAVVIAVNDGQENENVTSIRSSWEKWDGVVSVPGYPFKILPTSGVVLTPQLYSLLAETQALIKKG